MGNSPVGDQEKARIDEIIQASCTTWSHEFDAAVPLAAFVHAKAAAGPPAPAIPDVYPPLDSSAPHRSASMPLLSGRLGKAGADGASMKERFVRVCNLADNFRIEVHYQDIPSLPGPQRVSGPFATID